MSDDYAHPMAPFEHSPEPTDHAKPATWAPEALDVVKVEEHATHIIYTLTNNHTVRESKKHAGVRYCRTENNTTATCVFAVRRYLDRRAAA